MRYENVKTMPTALARAVRSVAGLSIHRGLPTFLCLVLACRPPAAPPSFVLVLIDTLREDYLGCYGFSGPISPNIDREAARAFVFDRCYAQAPWTKPSVASLFCSLYPSGHGVTNHEGRMGADSTEALTRGVLQAEARTLAETFRDRGYETAAFVANPWITRTYGFDQGFDDFTEFKPDTLEAKVPGRAPIEAAMKWLDHRKSRKPFFLYIHLMDVHAPYDAPESCYQPIARSPSVNTPRPLTSAELQAIPAYMQSPDWTHDGDRFSTPAGYLSTWRGRYGAGVRNTDDQMEPLLMLLSRMDPTRAPWLIVTSDHGEELFERGAWDHGRTLFEEQLRVPLILRPPGGLPESKRCGQIVSLIDVRPTLQALAGIPPTDSMDGSDLSSFLEGGRLESPGFSVAMSTKFNPDLSSLNVGPYKMIIDTKAERSYLYDLETDPGETVSLDWTKPQLAQELLDFSRRFIAAQHQRSLFHPTTASVTSEEKELLESLGYAN